MKELDKNALLEEAIRRFPIGTKYRVKEYGTGNYYLEGIVSKTPYWSNNGCEDIISGYDGILWSSKHGWSEPIEEPKVETKFEVGKWYHIKAYNQEVDYYIKCDDTSGTHASEFISGMFRKDPSFAASAGTFDNVKLIKELSLQEIQQYLPANHPDKIKQEVKEGVKSIEEWSVGSYVVFTKHKVQCNKYHIGDIQKITYSIQRIRDTETFYHIKYEEGNANDTFVGGLKWFPTLQEAQKFSDELLGKSKTGLDVEDLVEGEFYRHNENGNIFKWAKNKQFYLGDSQTSFEYADGCWEGPFSLANASEVKWLKTCIKQDKFIPKEELDKYDDEGNLMESEEYPEYYECINIPDINKNWVEGKIYKIRNSKQLESYENFIDEAGEPNGFCPHNHDHFRPSTKEAYLKMVEKELILLLGC